MACWCAYLWSYFPIRSLGYGNGNDSEKKPSQLELVGVQATAGTLAGACSSIITTPIDTIKTRLQVCSFFNLLIFLGYFAEPPSVYVTLSWTINKEKSLEFCVIRWLLLGIKYQHQFFEISLICLSTMRKVMDDYGTGRPSMRKTTRKLLEEDGWRGFYRGFGPRFLNMSLWGTSMIVTYELISAFFLPSMCSELLLIIILPWDCTYCLLLPFFQSGYQ